MSLIYNKNMGLTLGLTAKYTFSEEIFAKETNMPYTIRTQLLVVFLFLKKKNIEVIVASRKPGYFYFN